MTLGKTRSTVDMVASPHAQLLEAEGLQHDACDVVKTHMTGYDQLPERPRPAG